jgi:hypothetical protein
VAKVTVLASSHAETTDTGRLSDATWAELRMARRESTPLGIAALIAAERLDRAGMDHTGAGFAAMIKLIR